MSQLPPGLMTVAMATCHSLTTIGGEIMGDPLDLIMFEATGWVGSVLGCMGECACVTSVFLRSSGIIRKHYWTLHVQRIDTFIFQLITIAKT